MDTKAVFKSLLLAFMMQLSWSHLQAQSDSIRTRQHWNHAVPQTRFRIKNTYAPKDTSASKHHQNEMGLDATAMVMQVLHLTEPQFGGYYGTPEYYLTYRRYFKPGNIRAAIGGYLSASPIDNPQIDTGDYSVIRRAISVRLGWEFCSELSKRWQAFYGVDVLYSGSYFQNDWTFSNGGYQNGRVDITNSYGLGPVLGIRLRLNPRVSISTESRFSIHRLKDYHREFSVPIVNPLPLLPDEISDLKSWRTEFTPPTSLFFTFSF